MCKIAQQVIAVMSRLTLYLHIGPQCMYLPGPCCCNAAAAVSCVRGGTGGRSRGPSDRLCVRWVSARYLLTCFESMSKRCGLRNSGNSLNSNDQTNTTNNNIALIAAILVGPPEGSANIIPKWTIG